MWPNPQETTDLVTFTEEILNVKLHFLCSDVFTVSLIENMALPLIQMELLEKIDIWKQFYSFGSKE